MHVLLYVLSNYISPDVPSRGTLTHCWVFGRRYVFLQQNHGVHLHQVEVCTYTPQNVHMPLCSPLSESSTPILSYPIRRTLLTPLTLFIPLSQDLCFLPDAINVHKRAKEG